MLVDLTEEQTMFYQEIKNRVRKTTEQRATEETAKALRNEYMQLRKVCKIKMGKIQSKFHQKVCAFDISRLRYLAI